MATKRISTDDMQVGQETHIDIPAEGLIDRSAIHEDGIEIVEGVALDDYARELAFMEELIEVEMHESTDPNAQPIEDIYCNGLCQRFVRGRPQVVKRKYVQALASLRQVSFRSDARVEGEEVVNRLHRNSALRYPFSVVRDDNRRGRDWLRRALQSA